MIKKVKEGTRCDIGTKRTHFVNKWWTRCRLALNDKSMSGKKN